MPLLRPAPLPPRPFGYRLSCSGWPACPQAPPAAPEFAPGSCCRLVPLRPPPQLGLPRRLCPSTPPATSSPSRSPLFVLMRRTFRSAVHIEIHLNSQCIWGHLTDEHPYLPLVRAPPVTSYSSSSPFSSASVSARPQTPQVLLVWLLLLSSFSRLRLLPH